jgi:hypothetical protein
MLEGHDPAPTHWPLQTTDGASQTHVVGLLGGEGVSPSVHSNPQRAPAPPAHEEMVLAGYEHSA